MLLMGDFNEVLSPSERGSNAVAQEGVDDFRNFMQATHLLEVTTTNGFFTWFHGNQKSKLNRCLVNMEWITNFPNLSTLTLDRTISDHCPIIAQSAEPDRGPKPFRFMNCWISHPSYMPTVRFAWAEAQHLPIPEKLKFLKSRLKQWNKDTFGVIDSRIKDLELQIQSLDDAANSRPLNASELNARRSAQVDLWLWMKRKEAYWAQNSRSRWLKEGDRNTRYFHTVASIRRQKNTISSLCIDGTNVFDLAGIKKEAISFFQNIFKEDIDNRPRFENLEFKQLLPDHIEMLSAPFSIEEIDAAVASCDGNKAPGPDGLNFNFIKSAWDIVKADIYGIIHKFWATAQLPKGCNTAFITLIPKVEAPAGLKDFRPISMVGCIYKIVSKILARRLQQVMDFLIGPSQSSFIQGRQILDGALVASEIIDSCKKQKMEAVVLKLDFHKAFDSISWDYLGRVMK